MANFSKLIITDAGKQLLNMKLNSQQELLFTEMVMSEHKYELANLEELTDLEGIRQRVGIRKMSKAGNAIQINSVFLNSDLEEGYLANTLGVYASLGTDEPVLFAVAVEQVSAAYMPQKSQTLSGMEIKLRVTLENAENISIQMDLSAMATVGDVLELEEKMGNHISDLDNPHHTDKTQVGLDKVENTSDMDKPVSTKQQEAIDAAYQQSTGYTDQKIADLINGAPNTLDTLGEIAKAMQDNDSVVDTLDQAIGTKASQAELDGHTGNNTVHITSSERQSWNGKQTTTGDTKDNVVSFTSDDIASPTGWSDVALISSGEKHNSLWHKLSLFARNVRYLWRLMGSTSLNGIGDGTVTGAISQLNTGLAGKAASSHTHSKSQIADFPSALPASDVYAWAKAASKPGYSWGEISGKPENFNPSVHTHDDRYYTEGEINDKFNMDIEVESVNDINVSVGNNLLVSHRINRSGVYIVVGNVRPRDSTDGSLNIIVNCTTAPVYSENWVWMNGTPKIASCNHIQTTGFFHASEGTYICLNAWSSVATHLAGVRLYLLRIKS